MKHCLLSLSLSLALSVSASLAYAAPKITGAPTLDGPKVLQWPQDMPGLPDLSEPTANTLNDLHGAVSQCDLVLSTAGNYHMALKELWPLLFAEHGHQQNWLYTTSPPIALAQLENERVTFGNLVVKCRPQVAVAPAGMMKKLKAAGLLDGEPAPLYTTRGNVILVKKGNPKKIKTVFDLGRPGIAIVTPHPTKEQGAFNTYAFSIYDIAKASADEKKADALFNGLFNSGKQAKWFAGHRIHHREVPWSIAYGKADAGVIFYHLAKHAVETFPDLFEIVPLGGTAAAPAPMPGNRLNEHFIAKIKGSWTEHQASSRDQLFTLMRGDAFGAILSRHGMVPLQ